MVATAWHEAVHASPFPAAIADLDTMMVVDANAGALQIFERRDGRPVAVEDGLRLNAAHAEMTALLRDGRLDGFETRVSIKTADGPPIGAKVWVRSLEVGGGPHPHALVVVGDDVAPDVALGPIARQGTPLVPGATDDDWTVVWVTGEITGLLGYRAPELVGTALLGIVHPEAAADVVAALAHAANEEHSAIVHARLRMAGGDWRQVEMVLTPRPGLSRGVTFLLAAAEAPPDRDALVASIRRRLDQIVRDVRVAGLIQDGAWAHDLGELGGLPAGLSSRQWEIVTRLQRGERAPDIARAMHLSPSTVRNHLTAVFRKFGVHSQVELLAKLRPGRGVLPSDE